MSVCLTLSLFSCSLHPPVIHFLPSTIPAGSSQCVLLMASNEQPLLHAHLSSNADMPARSPYALAGVVSLEKNKHLLLLHRRLFLIAGAKELFVMGKRVSNKVQDFPSRAEGRIHQAHPSGPGDEAKTPRRLERDGSKPLPSPISYDQHRACQCCH